MTESLYPTSAGEIDAFLVTASLVQLVNEETRLWKAINFPYAEMWAEKHHRDEARLAAIDEALATRFPEYVEAQVRKALAVDEREAKVRAA